MALMMLRILVMARILDVPGFGRYSAGLLISTTFCMLGCVGLQSLLQRDMPIMAARGRLRRPLVLMLQALLVACACAVAALAAPLLNVSAAGLPPPLLAIAIVHGLSQQLFLVVTVESRSVGDPIRYSRQNLVRAVAIVACSAAVAKVTGSPAWALAVEAAITIVLAAAILARMGRANGVSLTALARVAYRRRTRANWSAALVFLAISLVASAVSSVDRWFGASLLSVNEFAQYAFAGVAVLIAQSAQSMINASVYPSLARRYAREGQAAAYSLSARVSLALLGGAALISIPVYFAVVPAVRRWYPAYEGALSILWLVLAVGVVRVSDFWSSFLMICGHERRLLALHVIAGCAVCAVWGVALLARGPVSATLADFAWLALALSLAVHLGAAIAATRAHRFVAAGLGAGASS